MAESTAADYLALEALIVARLQAETAMPDRQVLTAPDIEAVEEARQTTPAYHVIYAGDRPPAGGGAAARSRAQVVEQLWLVVIAVRNVRDVRRGRAARESAGPWVTEAIAALQGWRPGDDYSELRRDLGAPPAAYQAGFFYVPTLWAATFASFGTG